VFTDTRRFVDFVALSPDDRLCKTLQIPDPVTALIGDLELFLVPAIAPVFVDILIDAFPFATIAQGDLHVANGTMYDPARIRAKLTLRAPFGLEVRLRFLFFCRHTHEYTADETELSHLGLMCRRVAECLLMFDLPFGEKLLLQSGGGVSICFGEALDDMRLPVACIAQYELATEIAPIACLRSSSARCREIVNLVDGVIMALLAVDVEMLCPLASRNG
jgi:hypothetical protein